MRLDRFTAGKLEDLRLGGSLRGVAADSNGDVYVSRAGGTISGYTDDEGEFGSVSFGKSSDGIMPPEKK